MVKIKKDERDLFFYILVLLWAASFSLVGLWLVFRSYTPVPASAEVADFVLGWAMIVLIIASISGCLFVIRLFFRE
jgi:hypothetical protein